MVRMDDYLPEIRAFAAGILRALFVPFAAVRLPWEEFACRERDFLGAIHARVAAGKTRYLGWSAGANLACPTIKTSTM